jgi:hypothetical protein
MKKQINPTILCIMLILLSCVGAMAQDINEEQNLVYIRQKQANGFQLVSVSSGGRQVFEVAQNACYSLSPGMTYLALSTSGSTAINIFRLSDGAKISSIPPLSRQTSCDFSWRSETVLDIGESINGQPSAVNHAINILDGSPASLGEQPSVAPTEVAPSNLLADDFRLKSPDDSLIVYNRCISGDYTTDSSGDQICASDEELVIYNLKTQEDIQALEDTNQGRFVVSEYAQLAYSFSGIGWSPSGRYLAYLTTSDDRGTPPLRIYDTQDRRYLDFDFLALPGIDKFRGFVWTRDEQSLAFWVIDYDVEGERLAWANVGTRQIGISNTEYQLTQTNWTPGRDNRTIVFIDSELNLLEVNLDSDNATVVDTDVWDILSH